MARSGVFQRLARTIRIARFCDRDGLSTNEGLERAAALVVRGLRPEAWDEVLGFSDTARAAAAGAFAPNTPWVDEVGYKPWQGHSRAAQFAGSAIGHNAMHLGEAVTIRSLAGFAQGV